MSHWERLIETKKDGASGLLLGVSKTLIMEFVRPLYVDDDSMAPFLNPGDIILQYDHNGLQPGAKQSINAVEQGKKRFARRVEYGGISLRIYGDNLQNQDQLQLHDQGEAEVIGQVLAIWTSERLFQWH